MVNEEAVNFSKSEEAGIELLPADAGHIYSIGISTGGIAEMRMARQLPNAHIIATTIDVKGAAFAEERIAEESLSSQITVKVEDVAQPLPYEDGHFDYVYARLVLHYLAKDVLQEALAEIRRVLKPGGTIFVVVRSTECADAKRENATYDPKTCLTTGAVIEGNKTYHYSRYFHTEQTISEALKDADFLVSSLERYDETLFKDFMHTVPTDHLDNVVQVVATK